MDSYVTGAVIKKLREEKRLTQAELAERLTVSDKTVSKWETGRGYPDITLIEPIARALGISVAELFSGCAVKNTNRSAGMLRAKLTVCPLCGNVLFSTGEAVVSCCGLTLPPLDPEPIDAAHTPVVERVEDEYYVRFDAHDMTKSHFITFIAALSDNGVQLIRLYPEGAAEARLKISRTRFILWYCCRHGLFRMIAPKL